MEILKSITISGIPGETVAILNWVGADGFICGTSDLFECCNRLLQSRRIQDRSQFLSPFSIIKPPAQGDRYRYFIVHN